MRISDWLDEQEAKNVDVSQIVVPRNMAFDEDPEETIFYKEIRPCGLFCTEKIAGTENSSGAFPGQTGN